MGRGQDALRRNPTQFGRCIVSWTLQSAEQRGTCLHYNTQCRQVDGPRSPLDTYCIIVTTTLRRNPGATTGMYNNDLRPCQASRMPGPPTLGSRIALVDVVSTRGQVFQLQSYFYK